MASNVHNDVFTVVPVDAISRGRIVRDYQAHKAMVEHWEEQIDRLRKRGGTGSRLEADYLSFLKYHRDSMNYLAPKIRETDR